MVRRLLGFSEICACYRGALNHYQDSGQYSHFNTAILSDIPSRPLHWSWPAHNMELGVKVYGNIMVRVPIHTVDDRHPA